MNQDGNLEPSPSGFLSGPSLELYEALQRKDPGLAQMYLGAKHVLNQLDNPDRVALASHGFRELIEKLPRTFKTPITKEPPAMGSIVAELRTRWRKTIEKSDCYKSGFEKPLDDHLKDFLAQMEKDLERIEAIRPTRKERGKEIIKQLDPQKLALPKLIEDLRVKEWQGYEDYFTEASHHHQVEDYENMVFYFEDFLLNYINPKTTQDHKKILEIIEEGESGT